MLLWPKLKNHIPSCRERSARLSKKLMRPAATTGNLSFAFVKDPDGNQIELIMSQK